MATEVSRKNYGTTAQGEVVVIEKQFYGAKGLLSTFEVRHGVRTLDSGMSKAKAEALAKGLFPSPVPAVVAEPVQEDATRRASIARKALP